MAVDIRKTHILSCILQVGNNETVHSKWGELRRLVRGKTSTTKHCHGSISIEMCHKEFIYLQYNVFCLTRQRYIFEKHMLKKVNVEWIDSIKHLCM